MSWTALAALSALPPPLTALIAGDNLNVVRFLAAQGHLRRPIW